jgi:hypothetical protein
MLRRLSERAGSCPSSSRGVIERGLAELVLVGFRKEEVANAHAQRPLLSNVLDTRYFDLVTMQFWSRRWGRGPLAPLLTLWEEQCHWMHVLREEEEEEKRWWQG